MSVTKPDRTTLVPLLVAAVVAFVVLGPALRPGVVLAYDLAWSPDARLTPFALGTAGAAPRAVPSDAVAIMLGQLLGAGVAQSALLFGTLVLAGVGAARLATVLAPNLLMVGRVVAVIAAIWNPFVLERLVIGHWTVLLAYAALPHLLVAGMAVRRGTRPAWSPAVGIAACGVGGANGLVIVVLAVVLVLAVPDTQWRALAWSVASAAGASMVWALPALASGVASAPQGVGAFAAKADTPLGVLASLASGGGFWNPASHPSERSVVVVALVSLLVALLSWVAALRGALAQRALAIALPGVAGLAIAWASALDPLGAWTAVVVHLPGGGVLRDAQKLLAPWVAVVAAGTGVLAAEVVRSRRVGPALVVLVATLPVALLPSLAWGVGGRVRAIEVPADLRAISEGLSRTAGGSVGLLPWSQYRRYQWNGDRVSLTLVPRMLDHPVIFDDSLPLSSGDVPGENPAARRVTERITAGVPAVEALAREGVRWVVIEKDGGGDVAPALTTMPKGAVVVSDEPRVRVLEFPGASTVPGSMSMAGRLGWIMTCLTWLVAAACLARDVTRSLRDRLVGSGP
ncbi:hypothetical protein [Knoellia sp. Soil729]|uniref:hypothetical protein n=1 Tax=Knoellia sp. Soil729 TaxID=1736394 RepID=UPI0006FACFE7|nr:hypothetical protein [Knoellia sp. Soil729]KRE41313.1 hypothetical protein ASG74_12165 [Knoellia sp. Soil729]